MKQTEHLESAKVKLNLTRNGNVNAMQCNVYVIQNISHKQKNAFFYKETNST
jgi:hypothetical protein